MSFWSNLLTVGVGLIANTLIPGSGVIASLAKSAVTGLVLNKVTKSIAADNAATSTPAAVTPAPDYGVRLQVDPDPKHKIPVVYGQAVLGGIVTDAQISNNNLRMHYCLTLSEKTGATGLGSGPDSVVSFKDIYRNDQRIVFYSDGITAHYTTDRNGNIDYSVDQLIKVYCYKNGSSQPTLPVGYSGSMYSANSIMPNWTSNHTMNNLVFAIVEVNYNKDKSITDIGKFDFKLSNTLTEPGDCLYDYMTNTRYGAGIRPEEIYAV